MRETRLHPFSLVVVCLFNLRPMDFGIDIELIIAIGRHQLALVLLKHLGHLLFGDIWLMKRHGDMQIPLLAVVINGINNCLSDV
ncbi:hypothetical protein AXW94_30145 [Pseudomonas aeruginosa]|nr:hypothetical protein AXW94_30145 [Pseudomonas aeruginosa]